MLIQFKCIINSAVCITVNLLVSPQSLIVVTDSSLEKPNMKDDSRGQIQASLFSQHLQKVHSLCLFFANILRNDVKFPGDIFSSTG